MVRKQSSEGSRLRRDTTAQREVVSQSTGTSCTVQVQVQQVSLSAGQLVDTPRGGRRPARRRHTLGRVWGSRVGTDTGNGARS